MTEEQNNHETKPVEHKKGNPPKYKNALDQRSRRDRRSDLRTKYNNNRTPKNSGFLNMGFSAEGNEEFYTKLHKIKGWQKTNHK